MARYLALQSTFFKFLEKIILNSCYSFDTFSRKLKKKYISTNNFAFMGLQLTIQFVSSKAGVLL